MNTVNSALLTDVFKTAAADYVSWLEKKYPQKTILKLVGDRYSLNSIQRSVLYRGITTKENSTKRKSRLIHEHDIVKKVLHIDAFNVLITIVSYINGQTVFISTDGLLRDCTEAHGRSVKPEILDKVLDLIMQYIASIPVAEAIFYVDEPVNQSADIFNRIQTMLQNHSISGKALILQSPDILIKNLNHGICASSDSVIIDKSVIPIFDLPYHCISHHYNPKFIDLNFLFIS
jgi:hypothetical protein